MESQVFGRRRRTLIRTPAVGSCKPHTAAAVLHPARCVILARAGSSASRSAYSGRRVRNSGNGIPERYPATTPIAIPTQCLTVTRPKGWPSDRQVIISTSKSVPRRRTQTRAVRYAWLWRSSHGRRRLEQAQTRNSARKGSRCQTCAQGWHKPLVKAPRGGRAAAVFMHATGSRIVRRGGAPWCP